MSHSYSDRKTVNPSANPSFADVLEARLSRRGLLKSAAALAVLNALPFSLAGCATGQKREGAIGFKGVPVSTADAVVVPAGYSASVLYAWGDPIGHPSGSPAFRQDASNSAAEQALQAGMHHDGIHYFPLPYGSDSSTHGLLAMNHEYTDDGLLHPDGYANWNTEKVRKSQNAHGASVIEVRQDGGRWQLVRPSKYARRVTAATPIRISGPAAGAAAMKTAADPSGTLALGTFNDCAHGFTPWGTYLTCEENWDIFVLAGDPRHADAGKRGNIKGDAFGSPDGLWFDDGGILWIQTDVSASTLNRNHYANLGNNQMLAADIRTGEIRRFLTGPAGCEVTGVIMTPDARTLFVNIQHPGESPKGRNDPANPKAFGSWPDGPAGGRPRSATIVIRRNDGGIIGT